MVYRERRNEKKNLDDVEKKSVSKERIFHDGTETGPKTEIDDHAEEGEGGNKPEDGHAFRDAVPLKEASRASHGILEEDGKHDLSVRKHPINIVKRRIAPLSRLHA